MNSAWRASAPSPPPTATCATASCPTSTPSSTGPPPSPPPPSSRSAPWTWSRSSVIRTSGSSRGITPSSSMASCCSSPSSAGRRSCAGLRVLVRRHLDGRHSVWLGSRRLGLFDARGRALTPVGRVNPKSPVSAQGEIAAPVLNAALRACKLARAACPRAVISRCQTVADISRINDILDCPVVVGDPPRRDATPSDARRRLRRRAGSGS